MAVHVEDHPISYNSFEGTIPKGQYGAGTVIIWDRGTWEPIGDPRKALVEGKLAFKMFGQQMAGEWELVRITQAWPGAPGPVASLQEARHLRPTKGRLRRCDGAARQRREQAAATSVQGVDQ